MVLPSDVVEQDPDMEAMDAGEGAGMGITEAGPTEGAVPPADLEPGEGAVVNASTRFNDFTCQFGGCQFMSN